MDSKNPTSPGQTNTPAVKPAQPFIRTMQKDIKRLSREGSPPSNLPIPPLPRAEAPRTIDLSKTTEAAQEKPIAEKPTLQKEIQEAAQEAKKEAEAQKKAEETRKKEIEEKREKEEKVQKEAEKKAKKEMEKRKKAEEKARRKAEKLAKKEEKKRIKALRKQQGKGRSKFVFIILIIVLIIIGGGAGFFYWWNYIYVPPVLTHYECKNYQCLSVEGEGDDECLSETECLPPLPDSLVPVDETETIEILSGQENLLLEKIEAIALEKQEKGSLKRILIQLTNGEKEYASLLKFKDMIDIEIPSEIMAKLKNYTLFVYEPEMNEAEKCQEADISGIRCYGPRLGMVVQTTDKTSLKDLMKEWEKTIVNDLRPLILATNTEKTIEFQDDSNPAYPEADVRYKNLPISPIALNYAFFEDLLIIGTSKYSLYHALDVLIKEE